MKYRPILFSGEMVRAILEGQKSQTRRVANQDFRMQKAVRVVTDTKAEHFDFVFENETGMVRPSPYGNAGDRLWVRENLVVEIGATKSEIECGSFAYKADDEKGLWTSASGYRIIPSIFMPRWASRITLEIVNVRVERVQAIRKDDAKAEGMSNLWRWDQARNEKHPEHFVRSVLNPFVANFSVLWDEINGKRGFGWDVNPWVWVIEFKRISGTE